MILLHKDFDFLSDTFLSEYKEAPVAWGFASGPNSLGEITYRRTYSRDGEKWWETVRRVVEGTYEILYSHCKHYNLPFDRETAQSDAEIMYDLIFNFKFLPPGRGLWTMGTDHVKKVGGGSLNNCAFVSTKDLATDYEKPFCFLMDFSMLGVGVGFDTKGAGQLVWAPSSFNAVDHLVADSREGWVESLAALLRWGFGVGPKPVFDYSVVRPKGSPIKGFGGVSEGPEPLMLLHSEVEKIIIKNQGEEVSSRDIVDIKNMIGRCVVAGNVRRSAEIALGDPEDEMFLNLKNYDKYPERAEYGWASNNSLLVEVGTDYSKYTQQIIDNGEPGFVWLDNMRSYSRMNGKPDDKDWRVVGTNPCAEQSLESYELCCLVETFPQHHKSLEEYKKTLKHAFIYAKAVTLLPTHWTETNAVMLRNRRIGTSMSGVAQFLTYRGEKTFTNWCKGGYSTIQHYDRVYSEWLCVRESIKTTSVKPSGTVSLLAGATPGCHYPVHRYYIRRIRFAEHHPDVPSFIEAGYKVEKAIYEPGTVVVEFPVLGDEKVPTEKEVSIAQKMAVAVLLQEFWADNQVSCTVTFDPEVEGKLIPDLLKAYESRLKSISFLPFKEDGAYAQMPYEAITREQYEEMSKDLLPINWVSDSVHDQQDSFCDGMACVIPGSTPTPNLVTNS